MISPTISTDERIGLIKLIFSDRDEVEVFKYLSGNDAQALVDVIDEASICILLLLEMSRSNPAKTSIRYRLGVGWCG